MDVVNSPLIDLSPSTISVMEKGLVNITVEPAGPRNLRDAIGPSKGRLSQQQHMERLDYILHNIPQDVWPSTTVLRDKYLGQRAIILGGGPSLERTFPHARYLASTQPDKVKIFAPNSSHDWAIKGERSGKKKWKRYPLIPDFGVMLDPAEHVISYQTPHKDVEYLLGSTLDIKVLAKFMRAEANAYIWLPIFDGTEIDVHMAQYLTDGIDRHFVSGGSTVGLRTINLAASMGFTEIDLHGFDSCYLPKSKTLYAYHKPMTVENLTDYVIKSKVWPFDRMRVMSNSMMAKQVMEFADMITRLPELIIDGKMRSLKLRVHGDGAIPWLSWKASKTMPNYITHADPKAMEAKYGDCPFWDYVQDRPANEKKAA